MELPKAGEVLQCGDWKMNLTAAPSTYTLWYTTNEQYDTVYGSAIFFDPDLALAVWMMIQAAHRPEAKE